MQKLDMFNHIWPPEFYATLQQELPVMLDMTKRSKDVPMIVDLDVRFRVMDQFDGYRQILSIASSPPAVAITDSGSTPIRSARRRSSAAELGYRRKMSGPAVESDAISVDGGLEPSLPSR